MRVRKWADASVRTKLMTVTMATSLAALMLAGLSIIAYQLVYSQQTLALQLASRADLMGATTTAAVQFNDDKAGQESLRAFRNDSEVEAARIDLLDGATFASFASVRSRIPTGLPLDGVARIGDTIVVSRAIVLDGRPIGAMRVQGSMRRARDQVLRYLWILLGVLAASSLLAYVLSRSMQRVISGPIMRLAAAAGRVAEERDYSVRAIKESEDELGQLVERFNDMLTQIETRDDALREAKVGLESRVQERTRALELELVERQRTENALLLAKAAAEEASVAKSAFLANMSHELRTPLNAIIGYSEMVAEEAQDRGETASLPDLERITTAGRHLLALITDVLDLSKIEAGRMDLHVESFDAAGLVASAVATSQTLADTRGNQLFLSGVDGLGMLRSDQTKVQQVLLNLIGNACKFTSEGRIEVRCRRDATDTGDWLVIDIIDSGVGMTPDQVDRIFGEFVQADTSTTRRYGGTGLGLAISRRLCHLMGGSVTVASTPGQGSTFTLRLPADAPTVLSGSEPGVLVRGAPDMERLPPDAPDAPDPSARLAHPTVLVIDDDPTSRDLSVRALKRAGFRTELAATPHDGLRLARAVVPDVVILDVMMPTMTGWVVLVTMKRDPALMAIPVIIQSVVDDRSRSLALGAAVHLTKPIGGERLVEVVRSTLAARQAPLEAAS